MNESERQSAARKRAREKAREFSMQVPWLKVEERAHVTFAQDGCAFVVGLILVPPEPEPLLKHPYCSKLLEGTNFQLVSGGMYCTELVTRQLDGRMILSCCGERRGRHEGQTEAT